MLADQQLIRDLSQVNLYQDREQLIRLTEYWSEKLLAQAFTWLFLTDCFSLNEIVDLLSRLPGRNRMLVYADLPFNLQALVLAKLKERSGSSQTNQKINVLSLTNNS